MSVKRQFRCDLCHSEIRPDDQPGGLGILWAGSLIKPVLLGDSEHHLCGLCLKQLEAMFVDMRRMEKIRAEVAA